MVTINSKVNLADAFETLKGRLIEAEERKKSDPEHGYAYAYGFLKSAIAGHIERCTGENIYASNVPAANQDDLKDIRI